MHCRKTGEDGSEEVECTRAMELGLSPTQQLLSMKSVQFLEHHNHRKSKWDGHPENNLTLQSFLTVTAGMVYKSLVSPLSGLYSSPPCLQSLRGWGCVCVCEKQPQLWSPAPVLSGEEKPWAFRTIQPLWNYWKPSAKNQMTVSHRYKPDVGIPRLRSSEPQPSYAHPSLAVAARGMGSCSGYCVAPANYMLVFIFSSHHSNHDSSERWKHELPRAEALVGQSKVIVSGLFLVYRSLLWCTFVHFPKVISFDRFKCSKFRNIAKKPDTPPQRVDLYLIPMKTDGQKITAVLGNHRAVNWIKGSFKIHNHCAIYFI